MTYARKQSRIQGPCCTASRSSHEARRGQNRRARRPPSQVGSKLKKKSNPELDFRKRSWHHSCLLNQMRMKKILLLVLTAWVGTIVAFAQSTVDCSCLSTQSVLMTNACQAVIPDLCQFTNCFRSTL